MRAIGLDFSKWAPQFEYKGNVGFVIQRLSYGQFVDELYYKHKEEIKPVPIKEGYHYYSMQVPWKKQVDMFLQLGRDYDNLWWDAEEDQYGNQFGDRFANETAEALRYLRMEHPNAGLYCNRDIYYLLEHKLGASWLDQVPLWIADPRHDNQPEDFLGAQQPFWGVWRANTWIPFKRPKGSWTYWQVSFLGDPAKYGITGKEAVDEDVFNGTLDELMKLRGKNIVQRIRAKFSGRIKML